MSNFPDLSMDVYSGTIKAMHERYSESDIKLMRDYEVFLDYRTVTQARMTSMKQEDARKMAEELNELLENEILYRMNRWRSQARQAADDLWLRLTSYK